MQTLRNLIYYQEMAATWKKIAHYLKRKERFTVLSLHSVLCVDCFSWGRCWEPAKDSVFLLSGFFQDKKNFLMLWSWVPSNPSIALFRSIENQKAGFFLNCAESSLKYSFQEWQFYCLWVAPVSLICSFHLISHLLSAVIGTAYWAKVMGRVDVSQACGNEWVRRWSARTEVDGRMEAIMTDEMRMPYIVEDCIYCDVNVQMQGSCSNVRDTRPELGW